MKTLLTILLALSLSACHYNPFGKQYYEHKATIPKGKQGDGFQGFRGWRGDVIKLTITLDSTAWFPVASKFYGDVTPIFKSAGFGEYTGLSGHTKNGATVGWNPATRKGYFWIGTYAHGGSKTTARHYAMEVKAGEPFQVILRKSSADKKYYYLFSYKGQTIAMEEPMSGKEFVCYLTYFFLGGEDQSYVDAPHPLKCKSIYEDV